MRTRQQFLVLLIFLLFSSALHAQLTRQWVARFSGTLKSGSDGAAAMAIDDSGYIHVAGWVTQSSSGIDIATVKYNPDGQLLWVKYFAGSGSSDDRAQAIAVDSGGNVYVAGRSGPTSSSYDFVTIKYDRNGNTVWPSARVYNGGDEDQPVAIAVNDSQSVYVTGFSKGAGTGYDYLTVKYDSAGNEKWVRRFNGPANGNDKPYAMALRGTTDLYVTGTYADSGADYGTVKYKTATGDLVWSVAYNGPVNGQDIAHAIAIRGTDEVYVTGASEGIGTGFDYATIRYDSSGTLEWVSRYNGTGNGDDEAVAIALGGASRVAVTGRSLGIGSFYDVATVRYNQSNGAENWVARSNGPGNDDDAGISISGGSSPYVAASSVGEGTGRDYAVYLYDGSGDEDAVLRYNGPGNGEDIPASVISRGNAVYVTGSSMTKASDMLTIKYVDRDDMKYRTFVQQDLTGKGVNLKSTGAVPNTANIRDTAFARAYPKIKKGFPKAPGGLVLGNVYLDSAAYGWMRLKKGKDLIKFMPHTGAARGFDVYGGKPFVDEKKSPKLDKYDNHITGELIALRINIGSSDAEVTPPTFGDLVYEGVDTINGVVLTGMTIRQIAALVDNFLTYWPKYPGLNWALADSVLSRINRSFTAPLGFVSTKPLVVTASVPLDSAPLFSSAIDPVAEPLAFLPGSLDEVPERFEVYQNYPNPFNPVTTLEFELPKASLVTIRIFDILGREVARPLDNAEFDEGTQSIDFDGSSLASGIYLYQLIANDGEFRRVKKMMLLK